MAISINFSILLILLLGLSLLHSSSTAQAISPTISHSHEPFFLPPHFPTCIYTAFKSFIHTLPPHSSYNLGSLIEKEVACGAVNGTSILLQLRLLDSNLNGSMQEKGEALHKSFSGLLEEFRLTLKLRYKWAVIMSRHYWMEYQMKNKTAEERGQGSKNTVSKAVGGAGLAADQEAKNGGGSMRLLAGVEVDGIDCLPRGDVLVSHNNNGAGADNGFDILMAPHSLVSQNNNYYLMMQGNCNLVLYSTPGYPLWSSRTRQGKGSKCSLSLLRDGNLVITNQNNTRVWASGSSISCPSVFILLLQNDGNLVIYDMLSGLPLWATGTNQ